MSNKHTIGGDVEAKAEPASASLSNAPKPGPIVEDSTMVGGIDKETGAPVVKPKAPGGGSDSTMESTDPSE